MQISAFPVRTGADGPGGNDWFTGGNDWFSGGGNDW
ncbi:hypothetical protein EV137_7386 [Kribbella pratensis]|uniref:Uncharacterized protein n=1 Tax=Kribbella pratensis TaxID=2512112 RepID=A0ABY2F849_9ACTN|nr:hypothetical protein EV647_8072 [Kribbella sp. VKM Ac-2566]TDW84572.1 hypothetical protein EV137_7386 [Kribbella pratensis]